MSNENMWEAAAKVGAAVGAVLFGGLAIHSAVNESDESRASRAELKKERRNEHLKRSKAYRESCSKEKLTTIDVLDMLTNPNPERLSLRELMSIDCDADRYKMYEAMMADGVEFSNVQKEQLRQSFSYTMYQFWL